MSVVREFIEATGGNAPTSPPIQPDPAAVRLQLRLITEEFEEVKADLIALLRSSDPVVARDAMRRLLKELCDLRYVVEHCAVSLGLPIDEAYAEVHRANMSKLDDDGRPIRNEHGKVMKGPNYKEADMYKFVPEFIDVA